VRVILTGGSGMIGEALTRRLLAGGHEVVILTRNPSRVQGLPPGASAAQWDARSATGWGHLAEDAGIINLAGENISGGRWTPEMKDRMRDSRLDAGRAVVEAIEASARKPRVLVQASAVGYYGSRGNEALNEDSAPGGDFLARLCVAWEASTAPVEVMGVRRAVIRTAPLLSTDDGALPRMMMPFRFFIGGKLASGRQWFPWIHVEDHVAAICYLLENETARGPFNLVSPKSITNAQFARALGRAMHRPSAVPVPALALRVLYGELGDSLLESQRVIPQKLLDAGFEFRFADIEDALRDLLA